MLSFAIHHYSQARSSSCCSIPSLSFSMAKPHKSKPKSSLFLCCFGSYSMEESDFSWRRRVTKKKSASKTMPFDSSFSDDKKRRARQVHPWKWRWRLRSTSTSKSKSNTQEPVLIEPPAPSTNIQLPRQTPPVVPFTSNQTPSQTRHRERARQNHGRNKNPENPNDPRRVASREEDAREQGISAPTISPSVSTPASKRRQRRLSSMPAQPQTTSKSAGPWENARRYDPAFGLSAVLVTLVIMILWGRLCAIFCTSAWLYLFPRIRMTNQTDKNDLNADSKDLDLDSKVYKKKVILEGFLQRNHRARHENSSK